MKNSQSNLRIVFFVLLLIAAMPLFAAGSGLVPGGLSNLADSVVEIFTGGIVRAILIACLAGCAIAYGFNKDNEKMKRNIIAIGVSIVILVGAQSIVDAIWSASK